MLMFLMVERFFLTLVTHIVGDGLLDVGDSDRINGKLRVYRLGLRDDTLIRDGSVEGVGGVIKYGRGLYDEAVKVVVIRKERFFLTLVTPYSR